MPIICNPATFDKQENFISALAELDAYAARLGVAMPNVDVCGKGTTNKNGTLFTWAKSYGVYEQRKKLITINIERCRKPALEPVRVWTFVGYKTDLTPAGVLAHEFGHYLDDALSITERFKARLRECWRDEGCVSSYCPCCSEWFAETFRVWFLNPNLLELAKPQTAAMMLEIGIAKSHELTWQEIMVHAHEKWHKACKNFTSKRTSKSKRVKKITL